MAQTAPQRIWSSRWAFLLVSIGAAVGLGNIWRFPFIAGQNGGGAFVLAYIGFVFLIALPIMIAELIIGRRGHGSPIASLRKVTREEQASRLWRVIGWLSLLIPFVGLSYYSIVGGWAIDYMVVSASGAFTRASTENSAALFETVLNSPARMLLTQGAFILMTILIVRRGIQGGIEKAAEWMMPSLFLILVGLVGYGAVAGGFNAAWNFLFTPDFSKLTLPVLLMAMGQAFFSVAIGVGAIMTFSAYLPEDISLSRSAIIICSADTLVAILAGLAIFPIVFHHGLDPGEGPGLIFVTLPVGFGEMAAGRIIGTLFFILLFFAAFTTSIGMLEPVVSWLEEHKGFRRRRVAWWSGLAAWAIGVPSVLSFNLLKDFHPVSSLKVLAGKGVFDLVDFTVANVMLPVNGLLIALFAAWTLREATRREEFGSDGLLYRYWHFTVRYIAPLSVIFILLYASGMWGALTG